MSEITPIARATVLADPEDCKHRRISKSHHLLRGTHASPMFVTVSVRRQTAQTVAFVSAVLNM